MTASNDGEAIQATCCIVGGGPAGMVLAHVLAREGIDTVLLESHADFDRAFRGDTVHPSTMEVLEQLGLADRVLRLPHTRMERFGIQTSEGEFWLADFRRLKTKFPYVAMIDQSKLLDLLAAESREYPTFQLHMGANVKELVEKDGKVVGVRFQTREGWRDVRADLVVAADGRHSVLRKKAGMEPVATSAPMDILWFRLPKQEGDARLGEGLIRVGKGCLTVTLERDHDWQIALVIPKGGYHAMKEQGLEHFRATVLETLPQFRDRVGAIDDWKDVAVLNVESSCLTRWHKPGLLFIGDAAHVMSPVGGIGINYAVQDAVVAANLLFRPLLSRSLSEDHLAQVQRRREASVKLAQKIQSLVQTRIIGEGLKGRPPRPPFPVRFGLIRTLIARFVAYGWRPARLTTASV